MKKVILLSIIMFVAVAANAQLYVGGSVGVSTSKYKAEGSTDVVSSASFNIFPDFGYRLNNKLDIGLSFGYGASRNPSSYIGGEEDKSTDWEIAPYLRYNLVRFGKLSVLGRAVVFGGRSKADVYVSGGLGSVKTESKISYYGLDIKPVMTYSLSDRFDLLADLNFLSLSLYQTKKDGSGTTTRFNFGIDSNNIVGVGGNTLLTVGFLYKF